MSALTELISGGSGGAAVPTTILPRLVYLYNNNQGTVNFTPSTFGLFHGLDFTSLTSTSSYQNILNISGAGVFKFLLVSTLNQSAADLDFKITIDGVDVLTQEGVNKPQHRSYTPIGTASWYYNGVFQQNRYLGMGTNTSLEEVPFSSSFVVQVKDNGTPVSVEVLYDYMLT